MKQTALLATLALWGLGLGQAAVAAAQPSQQAFEIGPRSGDQVAKLVREFLAMPPEVKSKLQAILRPKRWGVSAKTTPDHRGVHWNLPRMEDEP